jgi:hypothetical protein
MHPHDNQIINFLVHGNMHEFLHSTGNLAVTTTPNKSYYLIDAKYIL